MTDTAKRCYWHNFIQFPIYIPLPTTDVFLYHMDTIHHNVYVLIMTMLHGEIITCYVLPDYFMYRPCPVTKTVTQSLVDNIT